MRRNQNCNSKLTLIVTMSLTLLFSGGVLAAGSHSGGYGHSDKHSQVEKFRDLYSDNKSKINATIDQS